MVNQLALLILFTLQLIVSNGDAASDVDTSISGQNVVVPAGYTPFPEIGLAYKHFDDYRPWESARLHCIGEGGNLAVIDSSKKVEYAKSLMPPVDWRKKLFVGISKHSSDLEWVNVKTGLPVSDIPWSSQDGVASTGCLGLETSKDGLESFDCWASWTFICEVPIEWRPLGVSNETTDGDTSLTDYAMVTPDNYTEFPDIGVAYKYFSYNLTWDSARKHCITEGGNLAVIDSFVKREYASSLVPVDSPDPYVGIHRLFDGLEWVDVKNGLPLEFVPWREASDMNDTTELCAGLLTTGVAPFSCGVNRPYMCEVQMSNQTQVPQNVTDRKPTLKSIMDLPSGYAVFPELGVAYKYYSYSITWNEARKYCITHGANLAIIDSYEKVECVISLKTSFQNVHVGAHRLFDDNKWVDVANGSSATAIPWRGASYQERTENKCMSLSTYGGVNGLFADDCRTTNPFVCELSIFKN